MKMIVESALMTASAIATSGAPNNKKHAELISEKKVR
jgi:hypothetical protein